VTPQAGEPVNSASPPTPATPVGRMLQATSAVVVGASPDADTVRGRALGHAKRFGFADEHQLFAVNPRYSTVQGVPCFPTVSDLPEPVDVALVAVPASAVPDVIRQCGAAGIGQAIVVSSGFAEAGTSGIALQERLKEAGRESGVRVLGPNCIGVMNLNAKRVLSFASSVAEWHEPPAGGPVAVISQSGAIGNLMLSVGQQRGLRLGSVVTTGNEADLAWADAARWACDDEETEVVVGYIESVRDSVAFTSVLRDLRERGKRVVILKSGRTITGARTSAGHTGTLAGDGRVFEAVCEHHGVQLVDDMRGLLQAAAAAGQRAPGRRVGIVTASGGLAAILADQCEDLGLTVPRLSATTSGRISDLIPSFGAAHNPIDVTGQIVNDPAMLAGVVEALDASGEVDAVGLFVGANAQQESVVADGLAAVARRSSMPIVACWVGGTGQFIRTMNERGIPAHDDPTDALGTIALLADRAESAGSPDSSGPAPRAAAVMATREPERSAEPEAVWTALEAARLPMVRREVCSRDELVQALGRWDGNVYVKTVEEGLVHKSDVGAVVGPIAATDTAAVRAVIQRRPNADRFEIQEAVRAKLELFLGVTVDPVFGPTALLGVGGLWVEAIDQVRAFVPPVEGAEIRRRMAQVGMVDAAMQGKRGLPPLDVDALAEMLTSMCEVAEALALSSLECNPVTVDTHGQLRIVDCAFSTRDELMEGAPL